MKAQSDWFKETCFGLWEANIQTESPVLVGWLLFSTNNIKQYGCSQMQDLQIY